MEQLRINEQIAFLRKQKGLTQEEIAQALGVSNQSVSKWESAQCCPDIQLLPDLAKLFEVSIDELMGCKQPNSFEEIYLQTKAFFRQCPAEAVFHRAFGLSVLLHEAACTKGYKSYAPWDTEKNHGLAPAPFKWGLSACSEPEGSTVYAGNGIFIADAGSYVPPTAAQIYDLHLHLERLADQTVLKVLYALYTLTAHDFDAYVSLSDISAKARLAECEAEKAMAHIPVTVKEDNGQPLYRMDGSYMHIPSLLMLFAST